MSEKGELEPLYIEELAAHPSGRFQYSVQDTHSGRELGTVRICDDQRFEVTSGTGRFAGVHRTLAEAMDALAFEAMSGTAPEPATAPPLAPQKSAPSERVRQVRRGIYTGLTARRRAAP